MARQVAVRSVVKSFGKLSFDQQKDALGQLQSSTNSLSRRKEPSLSNSWRNWVFARQRNWVARSR